MASLPFVRETDCTLPSTSIVAISPKRTNGEGCVAEGVTGINKSFNSSTDLTLPSTETACSPTVN